LSNNESNNENNKELSFQYIFANTKDLDDYIAMDLAGDLKR